MQKRKTGDKKNETRKASSFRRKGTLSRGLVVAGKAYLKKEKKKSPLPWSRQGQEEILKSRKPEQPSLAVAPSPGMGPRKGWPGLLLAGTHPVPPNPGTCWRDGGHELSRTLWWGQPCPAGEGCFGVCAGST